MLKHSGLRYKLSRAEAPFAQLLSKQSAEQKCEFKRTDLSLQGLVVNS